jgi:hypothetical protein
MACNILILVSASCCEPGRSDIVWNSHIAVALNDLGAVAVWIVELGVPSIFFSIRNVGVIKNFYIYPKPTVSLQFLADNFADFF